MAAKTKLAVLTALLSLAATAQVLAPASAAAMDDNGPQCTLSIQGGLPVLLDPEGNICNVGSGTEEEIVGDVYYVEDTKPKTDPPPNPRADGCYFGCLTKTNRPPRDRDNHLGSPDDRPGKGRPLLNYGQEKPAEKQKPPSRTDCKSPENGSMRSQFPINKMINHLIDTRAALPDVTALTRQRRRLESELNLTVGEDAKNLGARVVSLERRINEVQAKYDELSWDLERAQAQLEKELNAFREQCKRLFPDLKIGKN
jgi:hypothetical protein